MFAVRFAQPMFIYVLLPCVIICALLRWWCAKRAVYTHPLAAIFKQNNLASSSYYTKVFWASRFITLICLAILIGKPQLVDLRSKVAVDGIDIVLVLDASGSMQLVDDEHDKRSRFDIAKSEAIRFVEKRTNDALGLVIFGNDSLSRCPLTHDKQAVRTMISEVQLGDIDPDGTVLSKAMVTAVNRLKRSKAKSKVMILLTDGSPSESDMDPSVALEIVKKMGVKVYTVGIGSEKEEFIRHPFYGRIAKPRVNTQLLKYISHQTHGRSFLAHNAQDMRVIYDTIDMLETSETETPVFSKYYDMFMPFVIGLMALVMCEYLFSSLVWFGI